MAPSEVRIGLLWQSVRSANLGVGALALSNLAIAEAAAKRAGRPIATTIIGFGGPMHYPPANSAVGEHVIGSIRELLPTGPLARAIAACDIVLDIGAGDSWADIYGAKRFVWLWLSKEMALLRGRQLILSPQTIGPFKRGWTRAIAANVMRRASFVYTRDAESLDILRGMGIGKNAATTVDVAFRLPFERQPNLGGARIKFGFNVSGLLYNGGYSGKDQFGSRDVYRAMIDGVIAGLKARGDVDVVLVPHVLPGDGSAEDDHAASRAVQQRHPFVDIAPPFRSPSEAKSYISGLDILAGSRMHATIAAVSSGIAVVPLAYSRKFRGVFGSIGYPLVGDCTSMSADELVALTLSAVDRRHELAAAAKSGTTLAHERLAAYEDFVEKAIAAVPERGR